MLRKRLSRKCWLAFVSIAHCYCILAAIFAPDRHLDPPIPARGRGSVNDGQRGPNRARTELPLGCAMAPRLITNTVCTHSIATRYWATGVCVLILSMFRTGSLAIRLGASLNQGQQHHENASERSDPGCGPS